MIQDRARRGIKSIDMIKTSGRDPDFMAKQSPNPPDSRFVSLKGSMEALSKHTNTKGTIDFKGTAKRRELWGKPQP